MAKTVQARKAKGRRLQQWVVQKLKDLFPDFTSDDVRSTPMSVNGPDVQMSPYAKGVFPYHIECKNQEKLGFVIDMYEDIKPVPDTEGVGRLLFMRANNKRTLVALDAEFFIKMYAMLYKLYTEKAGLQNEIARKSTVH